MKAKPYTLLLHPAFLVSLAVLLLNDLYLKYAFHNGLTGKLSDFAGLFVFAVFLFAFFPAYKKTILLFCILFFCWWKSSLSSSFIQFANDRLSLPLHRTIDDTDLFALLILPLTFLVKPPEYSASFIRSAAIYTIGITSFFSFCATSMMPRQLSYSPYHQNEIRFGETFITSLNEEEVLARLDPGNLGYKKDSVRFYKIYEDGTFYQRVNSDPDSVSPSIPVANNKDTSLFIRKREDEFYILPRYILDGDTLLNLEFKIVYTGRKRKPISVWIESFQTTASQTHPVFYYDKTRKRYKKHFKRLFSK